MLMFLQLSARRPRHFLSICQQRSRAGREVKCGPKLSIARAPDYRTPRRKRSQSSVVHDEC